MHQANAPRSSTRAQRGLPSLRIALASLLLVCAGAASAGPIDISLVNASGISTYYYAFTVQNSAASVTKAEIMPSTLSSWIGGTFDSGTGVWSFNPAGSITSFPLPISVRLTDSAGYALTATDVVTNFTGGSSFDMGKQFPTSGGSPPGAVPEPATAALLALALALVLAWDATHGMARRVLG